jgi:transposase
VALVARTHGVNANLVFNWRRLYQAGRLGRRGEAKLLPVRVTPDSSKGVTTPLCAPGATASSSAGTIHIRLNHAQVSIEGSADPVLLRVLLECLQR